MHIKKTIRPLIACLIILYNIRGLKAQDYDVDYFKSPVKHKIILSGSFAEIRGSHFHTGLDIKRSYKIAGTDTIFASAEGYVSRIRTARGGYGRSLYIDHPNGYTTVYAHLRSFNENLSAFIRDKQYAEESYELDIYPEPGKFMIAKGEAIGILGNSGRSYGAHLHYEIRHTETEVPQNPMLFGITPEDHIPPTIGSVSVHALNDGMHKQWRQSLLTKKLGGEYQPLEQLVPASKVGLSINCIDQMDGAANRNGIYNLKMFVDDTLYFGCTFDAVSFEEFRDINTYIDYNLREDAGRTEALCFQLPSNDLSMLDTVRNLGVFDLYGQREVRFEVTDLAGNISVQRLTLTRYEQDYQVPSKTFQKIVEVGAIDTFYINDLSVAFKPNSLVNTVYLNVETRERNGNLIYRIGDYRDPILRNLKATLTSAFNGDLTKTIFAHLPSTGKPVSYGSKIVGDVLHTTLGAFGDYQVMVDEEGPSIVPNKFGEGLRKFEFLLDDNIRSAGSEEEFAYDVYIDGVWQSCEYKVLTKVLTVLLEDIELGSHELKIEAVDCRGNESQWSGTFNRI